MPGAGHSTTFGIQDRELEMALEGAVGQVVYNPLPRALKARELLPLVEDA